MDSTFITKLKSKWNDGKFVCVGLDSDYSKIPQSVKNNYIVDSIYNFNKAIVNKTADLVCAYKLNTAFYEAYGTDGWNALLETIHHIKDNFPEIAVILDAKRADIGNTNSGYAKMAFDYSRADAITVHPYLGKEALEPFLKLKDKGIIVLVKTSNPGAGEFQDLKVEGRPLYEVVAEHVAKDWNENGNCVVVVGATYPEELKRVRGIVGEMPILIPGIGAQGGDLEETVKAGKDSKNQGMIISASRSIIFASSGEDFAEAARRETEKLHNEIKNYLSS